MLPLIHGYPIGVLDCEGMLLEVLHPSAVLEDEPALPHFFFAHMPPGFTLHLSSLIDSPSILRFSGVLNPECSFHYSSGRIPACLFPTIHMFLGRSNHTSSVFALSFSYCFRFFSFNTCILFTTAYFKDCR